MKESTFYDIGLTALIAVLLALLTFLAYNFNEWMQGAYDTVATTSYVDKRVYGCCGTTGLKLSPRTPVETRPGRSAAGGHVVPSAPPTTETPPVHAERRATSDAGRPQPISDEHLAAPTDSPSTPVAGNDYAQSEPANAFRFDTAPSAAYGGWQHLPRAPGGVGYTSDPGPAVRPPAKPQSVPEPAGLLLLATGAAAVAVRYWGRKLCASKDYMAGEAGL